MGKVESMKKRLLTIIGVLLIAAALFTVIHFIWSDLYIAEFDADNAETVIWTQVTLETERLIDPDFFYSSQMIPVGGNLFFIPFVKAFGVGITALRAGYTVFAVLFAALLTLALRVLQPSWDLAMIGSGLIMICTTATETLRDIIWAHSVYYSLAVVCGLMCIGSLAQYLRGKRVLCGMLFFFSVLLCSINGSVVLLYTALPFAAAIFLESMNRNYPGEGFMKEPFLLICAAIVCGVVLNKVICSGNPSQNWGQYMELAPVSQWIENLCLLPERWLEVFFDLPETSVPVMSSVGIKLILRLGTALVLSILPFFSFFMLGCTKSRMTRIFILYHWILCAVLLFFFIFGMISNVSHRLIPLWFSCLIVDWLTMTWMLNEKGTYIHTYIHTYILFIGAASVCLTVLFAGMTSVSVVRKPANLAVWYGNDSIYNVLETHGLTHGYTTEFLYGNSVTVLSNGEITSRVITVTEDGFKMPSYMNKAAWYEDTPTDERTFLICWERELLRQYPWLEDEAVEVLRATQYTPIYDKTDGFFILVYDRDVIAENLRENHAFGDVGTQASEN